VKTGKVFKSLVDISLENNDVELPELVEKFNALKDSYYNQFTYKKDLNYLSMKKADEKSNKFAWLTLCGKYDPTNYY